MIGNIDAIIAYWINHLKIKPKKIKREKVIDFLNSFSLSLNSKTKSKQYNSLSDNKLSIVYQVIKK